MGCNQSEEVTVPTGIIQENNQKYAQNVSQSLKSQEDKAIQLVEFKTERRPPGIEQTKQKNIKTVLAFYKEGEEEKNIIVYGDRACRFVKTRVINQIQTDDISNNLQIVNNHQDLNGIVTKLDQLQKWIEITELSLINIKLSDNIMMYFEKKLINLNKIDLSNSKINIGDTVFDGDWLKHFNRKYEVLLINERTHQNNKIFFQKLSQVEVDEIKIYGKVKKESIAILLTRNIQSSSNIANSLECKAKCKTIRIEQTQEDSNLDLDQCIKEAEDQVEVIILSRCSTKRCKKH